MIIQSLSQIEVLSRQKYLILLNILIDNCLYYLTSKKKEFEVFIITEVLTLSHIFASNLFRSYFRISSKIPLEILNLPKGRYLIVANHLERLDPFLIFSTLPLTTFRQLLPIRFFTANLYLKYWWQRLFLLPFGCFQAYKVGDKTSGVKGGLQLSDRGQTLFIFPEGKRNKDGSLIDPKVGVAYLAKQRDFTILPVCINQTNRAFRKKTRIFWGEPFRVTRNLKVEDLSDLTKYIFDHILSLSAEQKIYER